VAFCRVLAETGDEILDFEIREANLLTYRGFTLAYTQSKMAPRRWSLGSLELAPRASYSAVKVQDVPLVLEVARPARDATLLLGGHKEACSASARRLRWVAAALSLGAGVGGTAFLVFSSPSTPAVPRFGAASAMPFAPVERQSLVKNAALWAPADPAAAAAPFPTGAWWSNLAVSYTQTFRCC
jgi:hypothetical protein